MFRAKLYNRKRYAEKIQIKKKIKVHEQRQTKNKKEDVVPKGAVPAYLLDRYSGVCIDLRLCGQLVQYTVYCTLHVYQRGSV